MRRDVDDACLALAGERWAERRLRARGLRPLARRLRTRWGEIDLLLEERDVLVVCEVKTGRTGPRFRPGMRLGFRALEARWRAARALAHGRPYRVDLAEVRLRDGRRPDLVHVRGIRRPLPSPAPPGA